MIGDSNNINSDIEHIVNLEEYVFGHRGGMGPIAWSSTISKDDQKYLYNTIESFQSSIMWEESKWALNWGYLPSKKIAITAIFPDSDSTGRSTVLGHTLILKYSDFVKIQCNPFVLFDLGFFSSRKDIPPIIQPREITIHGQEILNICRKSLQVLPKGLKGVLDGILGDSRKIFLGTILPANTLVRCLVCCLPPHARSSFTFSTLEVNLANHMVGRLTKDGFHRNIRFLAISLEDAKSLGNKEGHVVYILDGDTLKSVGKDSLFRENIYSDTIFKLLHEGTDITSLFSQGDNSLVSEMDQTQYTVYLKYLSGMICSSRELKVLQSLANKRVIDTKRFFCLCMDSLKTQDTLSEWEQVSSIIEEEFVKERYSGQLWCEIMPVYENLLSRHKNFSNFILGRFIKFCPEHYLEYFTRDLLPKITLQMQEDIRNTNIEGEYLFPLVSQLLGNRQWANSPEVWLVVEEFLNTFENKKWEEVREPIIQIAARNLNVERFRQFIEQINLKTNKFGQERRSTLMYRLAMQLKDEPSLQPDEKFEKFYIAISKCEYSVKHEHSTDIILALLKIAIRSGSDKVRKRVFEILKEEQLFLHQVAINKLSKVSNVKFAFSREVVNYLGFKNSFLIAKATAENSTVDWSSFYSYLEVIRDMYFKGGFNNLPDEFYAWAKKVYKEINSYKNISSIPYKERQLLADFRLIKAIPQKRPFLEKMLIILNCVVYIIIIIEVALLCWLKYFPESFPFHDFSIQRKFSKEKVEVDGRDLDKVISNDKASELYDSRQKTYTSDDDDF